MRWAAILLSACVAGAMQAQVDLPVFGKQHVINGYAKDSKGEVLSYFSVYPEHATTALLTRCTDGKKAIAWETAPLPLEYKSAQYHYFSWIAAHNSTTSGGDRSFDLYINDQLALTFTTHHSTKPATWSAAAADSTKLVFEYSKMDRHGDAHGFAHLRVPLKYIKPGRPLQLKVVGHAQDSPDWFMTFRYTFEEKVEVEVLPFVYRNQRVAQPIAITLMHFGAPVLMYVGIGNEHHARDFPVRNGLQVIETPIWRDSTRTITTRITARIGEKRLLDTTVTIDPIIHRDIHLIHHSHTDIGYSHLQAEVQTIQNNNIFKALELIDRTKEYPEDSRFVWNVESLWAVENFLGIASETDKQRFIAAVKSGGIALSANYANILTGLCTPEEMHWIVEYADSLRAWYGLPINSAMQTDVPGMSWSMVDAYAAHGIRYLSQGPNYIPDMPDGGDRIGSTLREQGDMPYWWKGTTGRDSILVWTAGQGYGGWHGYTAGAIKERGTRKIAAYMNELTTKNYPYDMVQWRYNIVSDNGPVDSTISDFVRDWNEKYSSPRLIISNVGDMMSEFDRKYGKQIPTWSGDFTPYWEDGAYSTADWEGHVRVLSAWLTNLIDAAKILNKPIDPHLLYRAKRSIVMWHEHTWGSWNSISEPDAPFTIEQWRYKKAFADSAGWYVEKIESAIHSNERSANLVEVLNTLPWERSGQVLFSAPPDGNWTSIRSVFQGRFHAWHRNDSTLVSFPTIHPHSSVGFVLDSMSMGTILDYGMPPVDSQSGGILRLFPSDWLSVDPTSQLAFFDLIGVDGLSATDRTRQSAQQIQRSEPGEGLEHMIQSSFRVGANYGTLEYIEGRLGFDQVRITIGKGANRDKESLHLALPFNIPNATVRIGISDTCITPESGRVPGSNNDFFCAQRWIDVSNDSMGVTIVCPQGALWEVGEMVDERKVNPGRGTNPEYYKAWKTEAKSSSTLYLYALNNYWHTNFKADQEGPITFDIYLKMHGPFKLEDARRFGLEMTRPLITWWK